jgi:hypothetical protein
MRLARRLLPLLILACAALYGQSEAALRDFFEGRYVTVKIDMPATKDGVDVYPSNARPLDLQRYGRSIKTHGTALQKGDSVMVTLVKVKEKNIEFQLGGGGFGTLGDDTGQTVYATSASKTKREKELEQELKGVTDRAKKKSIERELSDLRNERTREEARLRAEAAQAEEARKARVRDQALGAGSRFNLRFPDGVTAEMLTPQAILDALAEYVEFPEGDLPAPVATGAAREPRDSRDAISRGPGPAGLRKGMTVREVAAALGEPESCSERGEGTLKVATCRYRLSEASAECQFVDGVLLRYTIASE